jgi:hypothetical protein
MDWENMVGGFNELIIINIGFGVVINLEDKFYY